MGTAPESAEGDAVLDRLRRLEARMTRIEAHLDLREEAEDQGLPGRPASPEPEGDAEDRLEIQLGQNWFAKLGIVVLALGIVFLLTFPYRNLPAALPTLVGYALVGALVAVARRWDSEFRQVSRYLLGGALLLLYFSTLRLSHFGPEPAVASTILEFALLAAVVAVNLVVAVRRQSVWLAGLSLTLGYGTALAGRNPYLIFASIAAMSAVAVFLGTRQGWGAMPALGIGLAILAHALWAAGNPLFEGRVQPVSSPEANLLFLLLYALVFGAGILGRERRREEHPAEILAAFANSFGFYALFLLLTLPAFGTRMVPWHLSASALYLALAVLHWVRRESRYATFAYAILGYTALSVAIIAAFPFPDFFVWLCWQSVLVVSTAVWFRSRFVVVANFAIYLLAFFAYVVSAGTVSAVGISFGIVALLSARILNWQRDRLELRTEAMRIAYLASALLVIPFGLYQSVPRELVSLSWLAVGLLYYLASRLLRNRKYRWMALMTTSLTVLHVLFVDMVGVDRTLRIVSFLVLGTALLVISMVYTRRRARPPSAGGDAPGEAPPGHDPQKRPPT